MYEDDIPLREKAADALRQAHHAREFHEAANCEGTTIDTDFHFDVTVPPPVIKALNTIGEHASQPEKVNYKYQEDRILGDFKEYIDSTYGQHYKTDYHQKVECFDAWLAMGDATPTFRNTAIKYLWRYGRKSSYTESKKDLFKALHYTLMCLYNDHYSKKK